MEKENKKKEKYINPDDILYSLMDIFGGTNMSYGHDIERDAKKYNYFVAIIIFIVKVLAASFLVMLIVKYFNIN